jgi:hypothetical protein
VIESSEGQYQHEDEGGGLCALWLKSVILATWEAETARIAV